MILTVNPGSTSLKFKLFDEDLTEISVKDYVIGEKNCKNHKQAVNLILLELRQYLPDIKKIAVRVVHGGPNFEEAALINDEVISEIKKYSELAPLHNPPALETIKSLRDRLKREIKNYAVFDTGFFKSLPEENSKYAIPPLKNKFLIKRYGFHGISHRYMKDEADPEDSKKLITIHLGAGCSMSAILRGKVIKTTMGLTPDEGLLMQTRSGDLDPGLVLFLSKKLGVKKAKFLIENKSGLSGLTGTDGAMLEVLYLAEEKISEPLYKPRFAKNAELKRKAELALKIYTNKIKEYIGAYSALMNGVDEVVFSGKIGAGSQVIRNKVMADMEFLGKIKVTVIKPNEELAMARKIADS